MLLETAALVAAVILVVQIVRLILSDCDLTLQWADKFGKSPDSLLGKVIWVTGASSGIGEHLVYKLAASGCRLVLSARREEELNRVKAECLKRYDVMKKEDILVVPLDLVKNETHSEAVETVLKYFKRIDCLVNNAGRSQRALWSKTPVEVDRACLEVNTLGPLSLTKAVLPHMAKQGGGHFVVVTSAAAKFGAPGIGSYSGCKFALHGWFETLRIEGWEDNIKVTMVCPGPVFSDALRVAFTDDLDKSLGVEMNPSENRMSTERCAHLMSVAIANQLDEVWVSPHPVLSYFYLFQYFPTLARKTAVYFGQTRYKGVKNLKHNLH